MMLKASGFGDFKYLHDDQVTAQIAVTSTPDTVRRYTRASLTETFPLPA